MGSTLDKTPDGPYACRNGIHCFDHDVQPEEGRVFRVEGIIVVRAVVGVESRSPWR